MLDNLTNSNTIMYKQIQIYLITSQFEIVKLDRIYYDLIPRLLLQIVLFLRYYLPLKKMGLLISSFSVMVKAHLKLFSDSSNSFPYSSILPASFVSWLTFSGFSIKRRKRKRLKKLILSIGADG